MERTQHKPRTEPPELSPDVRDVLLAIADRLTAVRPNGLMTEGHRMAKSLRYSEEGRHMGAALAMQKRVLVHMPRITREISRGEYGIVLRGIAGGAR